MPRKKPDNKNLLNLTLGAVFLLAAATALIYLWSGSGNKKSEERAISESTPVGRQVLSGKDASSSLSPSFSEEEGLPAVSGNNQPATMSSAKEQCLSLAADIEDLFTYLDSQAYIADFQLPTGTQKYAKAMLSDILSNPPVLPEKRGDSIDIMKNSVHFYRVLGAKNLMLLKDYLGQEGGRLEYDLNLFYDWAAHESCRRQTSVDISLPLEKLYQYASFFLTTKGGQSYLLRRSDRIANLVQYYCIRIVDLADTRQGNTYGIDLLPPINALLFRLQSDQGLEEKGEYLATLEKLRQKYLKRLRETIP